MIQMLMIEHRYHLFRQHPVELTEVHAEARLAVHRGLHGDGQAVIMTVPVSVATGAEHRSVAGSAPLRPVIVVRGGEADGAGEESVWHFATYGAVRHTVQIRRPGAQWDAAGAEVAATTQSCGGECLKGDEAGLANWNRMRSGINGDSGGGRARGGDPVRPLVAARILIAEDHLDSRDAMCSLLEAFGYDVIQAANGREAIEVALRDRPDLILMDIMMPELDGFDATRELRRHHQTALTPIIAVTAMEGAHELALQAGANDFIRKPIDIRGLVAKVHDWLESASA